MSTPSTPQELRIRATALRRLSNALSTCSARTVYLYALEDTWVGPTPSNVLADLHDIRRTIDAACSDLVTRAIRLETEADLLDTAAGGGGSGRALVS